MNSGPAMGGGDPILESSQNDRDANFKFPCDLCGPARPVGKRCEMVSNSTAMSADPLLIFDKHLLTGFMLCPPTEHMKALTHFLKDLMRSAKLQHRTLTP